MKRLAALVLAYFFLALAIIGIFIPGLPTVPFLLLAAWFAARGSKKLYQWLHTHPRFGKILIDWQQQKAIPRRGKIAAVVMLTASWIVMNLFSDQLLLHAGTAVLFIVVGLYIITRPEPD